MKSTEERLETKSIRELRKKNQRLVQEVRRLRKQLRQNEADATDEEEVVDDEVAPPSRPKQYCPKCNSDGVYVFELRGADYYKCDACETKGRFTKTH